MIEGYFSFEVDFVSDYEDDCFGVDSSNFGDPLSECFGTFLNTLLKEDRSAIEKVMRKTSTFV